MSVSNTTVYAQQTNTANFKIQDYYLIRDIKTWLNINHITVHNNIYFIF